MVTAPTFIEARDVLRRLDRLTVPDLAQEICVSYSRAREILEEMVDRGWVRRTTEKVRTSDVQGRHSVLYEYVKPTGRYTRERRKPVELEAVEQYRDIVVSRGQVVSGKRKRAARKEVRDLLALIEKCGWSYEPTNNNHYLVYHPDGYPVTTVPATPSDWRSLPNALADCRRAGMNTGVIAA